MNNINWNSVGYFSNPSAPDDGGFGRDIVVDDKVEELLSDKYWVAEQFENCRIDTRDDLLAAVKKGDEAAIGKIMMDLLRDLAYDEAEEYVDSGKYADDRCDGP